MREKISKSRNNAASRRKPKAGKINRSFIPSTNLFPSSTSTSSSSLEMAAASPSHRRSTAGASQDDPALEGTLHVSNASVCASSRSGRLQNRMPSLRSHVSCGCSRQISGRISSGRGTTAEDAHGEDDLSMLNEEDRHLEIVDLDPETSSKNQKILFAGLVALCVIILIAYVIAIVFLFAPLLRQTAQTEASWQISEELDEVCDPPETCISESNLKDVFKVLKQRQSVVGDGVWLAALLPKEYSVRNRLYCFKDQKWFQKWAAEIAEIYKEVRGSVNNIKAKQHTIAEAIISTQRLNNTGSLYPAPVGNIGDATQATFAHFRVDIMKSVQDKSHISRLKFFRQGIVESDTRRMVVNPEKGEIKIVIAGFYFLYSHVVFRADDIGRVLHRVIVVRNTERVLLESSARPTSVLQGVFSLQKNDVIIFNASTQLLDSSKNKVAYIGLYHIRT